MAPTKVMSTSLRKAPGERAREGGREGGSEGEREGRNERGREG